MSSASWANARSNNDHCRSPPTREENEDTSGMVSTATLPESRQEPPIVQDCSFLNLPLEIRLKILEYLLPELRIKITQTCTIQGRPRCALDPTSKSFFKLVPTSKQIYRETKLILETVPVDVISLAMYGELDLSMWPRCVVGNVYRLVHMTRWFDFPPHKDGCDLGNAAFPNLQAVRLVCMGDHPTSARGHKLWHKLFYGEHLLPYIRRYLRSRTGPSIDDMSELSERLRQGRDQHPLHLSHDMGERAYAQMQERGVDLMSIYYFGIRVLVPLGWPYADGAEDIIYENFFEVKLVWGQAGARILGLPDLSDHEWWQQWVDGKNHFEDRDEDFIVEFADGIHYSRPVILWV